MIHMNEYDLRRARDRFTRAAKPNRLALVMVVDELRQWADEVSDGWAYWAAPRQAALRAMNLIESTTNEENARREKVDVDEITMRHAVVPIKALLTRWKVAPERRERILRAIEEV